MSASFDHLPKLHSRRYDTTSYLDGDQIKVVGVVHDVKPAGLYIVDDPEPLGIHQMQVVLTVETTSLTIIDADVSFSINPHEQCPSITEHYRKLIGLSVSRGFSSKVRELFGGPRGCSHTTALLLAMGPVVTQSLWSMSVVRSRDTGVNPFSSDGADIAMANLNTCHIWAEDGDHVAQVRAGTSIDVPVWITNRYKELGRSVDEWTAHRRTN